MFHRSHLSSRPGRRSAGSMRSGREEAARTHTPSRPSTCDNKNIDWSKVNSYPIELCQQLVDYSVGDTGGILTPPRGQRFELVEENEAWTSSLSSFKQLTNFGFTCADVP